MQASGLHANRRNADYTLKWIQKTAAFVGSNRAEDTEPE
jgi:hypothetical protein